MAESGVDTERTTVRTYVPAYQRDEWDEHADELGMSRSEFVRTMVQAGRKSFGADVDGPDDGDGNGAGSGDRTETVTERPDLESRVVEALADGEYLTWEALVARLTEDVEERLESTLDNLQADNRVRYSGRNGGYTLEDAQ